MSRPEPDKTHVTWMNHEDMLEVLALPDDAEDMRIAGIWVSFDNLMGEWAFTVDLVREES